MNKNINTAGKDSKNDMSKKNDSLLYSLQQQFPQKSKEEIEAAIEIAGPDQKEIEDYLTNPVNGEGFTPAH